jgi:ribosome-associated protein
MHVNIAGRQPIVNRSPNQIPADMPHETEPVPADDGELVPGVRIAPGGVRFAFSRASGPGGQNVNKVSTKAELRVAVGDLIGLDQAAAARLRQFAGKRLDRHDQIVIVSAEQRSQSGNREACMQRLRELVAKARIIPRTRRRTKPSRGSRERRLQTKRATSQKKSLRRVQSDE